MRGWRREEGANRPLPVLRANSIFDWPASRHSRLRQGSKIDYSSITLRLVSSFIPSPFFFFFFATLFLSLFLSLCFLFSSPTVHLARPTRPAASLSFSLFFFATPSLGSVLLHSRLIAARSPGLSASRGVP